MIGHLLERLRSNWLKLISCSYPTSQSQLAACWRLSSLTLFLYGVKINVTFSNKMGDLCFFWEKMLFFMNGFGAKNRQGIESFIFQCVKYCQGIESTIFYHEKYCEISICPQKAIVAHKYHTNKFTSKNKITCFNSFPFPAKIELNL